MIGRKSRPPQATLTRGRESGDNHLHHGVAAQEFEEGGVSEGGRWIADSHWPALATGME